MPELNGQQFSHTFHPLNNEWGFNVNTSHADELMGNNQGRLAVGKIRLTEHYGKTQVYRADRGSNRPGHDAYGYRDGTNVRWYNSRTQLTESEYGKRKNA